MNSLIRITCPQCRTSFVSGHQGVLSVRAQTIVAAVVEHCPHCGATSSHRPDDYYRLVDVATSDAGDHAGRRVD